MVSNNLREVQHALDDIQHWLLQQGVAVFEAESTFAKLLNSMFIMSLRLVTSHICRASLNTESCNGRVTMLLWIARTRMRYITSPPIEQCRVDCGRS
jgi:hypothetical protein